MPEAPLLFTLRERLQGRDTMRFLARKQGHQWFSPDRIEATQFERLRTLLSHCADRVPFYKKRFAERGVDVRAIRSLDDFEQAVPVLDKQTVRGHLPELHADNADKHLTLHRTSGSTGEPLAFPLDRAAVASVWANALLTRSWWDVSIGDPVGTFWGVRVGAQSIRARLGGALKKRIENTTLFSAYDMSDANMLKYARRIARIKPKVLYGYASALDTFARFLDRAQLDCEPPRPRVVIATTEVLQDETRANLSRVFKCPAANEYGCCEEGFLAFECPSGGFHILEDSVLLEVVDEEGRDSGGEIGEVLITQLDNYSVPLVRYRLGDLGRLSSQTCQCGRGLKLLDSVVGRKGSVLLGLNGNRVYNFFLVELMKWTPGVRRYQVRQDRKEHIDFLIEPDGDIDRKDLERTERELVKRLGEGTTVDFQMVEEIKLAKTGKYEYIVSNVAED